MHPKKGRKKKNNIMGNNNKAWSMPVTKEMFSNNTELVFSPDDEIN
jgi:hypothetical protein